MILPFYDFHMGFYIQAIESTRVAMERLQAGLVDLGPAPYKAKPKTAEQQKTKRRQRRAQKAARRASR